MHPPPDLVPLSKIARRLGGVHISTVHRWRLRGVGGTKLKCVKIGGRWFASETAVADFLTELNGGRDVSAVAAAAGGNGPKAEDRRRAAEAVALEQRLIARGL